MIQHLLSWFSFQVSSSGFPTPISGMSTRPGSNITTDGSFPSSCSSALSSVEDRRMDELMRLDDGVRDQKIQGKMNYGLVTHMVL